MSVLLGRQSARHPLDGFPWKFGIGNFYKKSIKKLKISSKSGKKYRPLYAKNEIRFIVAFDIKSPSNSSLRVKLYEVIRGGTNFTRTRHPTLHCFLLGALAQNCNKLLLVSSCLCVHPSVYPHGTTRLRVDGFP